MKYRNEELVVLRIDMERKMSEFMDAGPPAGPGTAHDKLWNVFRDAFLKYYGAADTLPGQLPR